jgi:hypothetical protein
MQKTIDDGCFVDIGLRGPMWNGDEIMCEIMEKLATEARDEGIVEGIAEGIAIGKAAGTLEILNDLVQDGVLTITEAAKRANMTEVIFMEKTQQFRI